MGPLLGMLMAGGASGIFGGAGGGGFMGGLMSGLMQGGGGLGGLGGLLSNLFGGGQQAAGAGGPGRGNDQTNQLLGDIKDMLGQLLDGEGGGDCAGGAHRAGPGGGWHKPDDGHGCSPKPSSCHDDHGCDGVDDPEWDGADKSPSLDRECGAARLLEQARNTDDPGEKRELIDMAMEMLGDGPKKKKGFLSDVINDMREKQDGNSYDKDIVKQADKMLDQIDEGHLGGCAESKALDGVIDMLMEEGGVDGQPATSDTNGNGREDVVCSTFDDGFGRPVAHHHHLHSALFDHQH